MNEVMIGPDVGRRSRRVLFLVVLAMIAIAGVFAGMQTTSTSAFANQCSSPTDGSCLPGSGYSYNDPYCGVVMSPSTGCSDHTHHSWGFNSSDYDGSGSVYMCDWVEIPSSGADQFGACDWNLHRSCWNHNCDAQSVTSNLEAYASQGGPNNHTVYGHAEA